MPWGSLWAGKLDPERDPRVSTSRSSSPPLRSVWSVQRWGETFDRQTDRQTDRQYPKPWSWTSSSISAKSAVTRSLPSPSDLSRRRPNRRSRSGTWYRLGASIPVKYSSSCSSDMFSSDVLSSNLANVLSSLLLMHIFICIICGSAPSSLARSVTHITYFRYLSKKSRTSLLSIPFNTGTLIGPKKSS